ncbi:hypothetical protein L493_1722 [Bordetella bronchiseptica 99-R-0433]|nr:hypothetical protein L493_1722 [Bordetella bronchiseptica 99-R-0433]
MRSGCLHDRPHTRRVCARREQDSAGACPPAELPPGGPRTRQEPVPLRGQAPEKSALHAGLSGFSRCLSPREGQAPRIRQVPVPRAGTGT